MQDEIKELCDSIRKLMVEEDMPPQGFAVIRLAEIASLNLQRIADHFDGLTAKTPTTVVHMES